MKKKSIEVCPNCLGSGAAFGSLPSIGGIETEFCNVCSGFGQVKVENGEIVDTPQVEPVPQETDKKERKKFLGIF